MAPKVPVKSALAGAAFLMATSAIGPGFITQTTTFTWQLGAGFLLVILFSILLDIGAQLNIWRILVVSKSNAQDLTNRILPGLGWVLALLVVFGGMAFNIGNVAGAGLGWTSITGKPEWSDVGVLISVTLAIAIFWVPQAGKWMDYLIRFLGLLMILLTLYVVFKSNPPVKQLFQELIQPKPINYLAVITLVGGTVGGYISFSGAHRLLDAGYGGTADMKVVTKSSVSAILLASVMRLLLFLAAWGVVSSGVAMYAENPGAGVFRAAAGTIGEKLFGLVLWAAALTSIIGSAFTSISFLRSLVPFINNYHKVITTCFILLSTGIYLFIDRQPVTLLILAGTLNGLILPLALGLLLLAVHRRLLPANYRHPFWLLGAGWLIVLLMGYMGVRAISQYLS